VLISLVYVSLWLKHKLFGSVSVARSATAAAE